MCRRAPTQITRFEPQQAASLFGNAQDLIPGNQYTATVALGRDAAKQHISTDGVLTHAENYCRFFFPVNSLPQRGRKNFV